MIELDWRRPGGAGPVGFDQVLQRQVLPVHGEEGHLERNSASEADMMLPHSSRTLAAKRSLNAAVNGNGNVNGGGASGGEPDERSGRRPDSPASKRLRLSLALPSVINSLAR
ncbi:hypothetical protein ABZP36_009591 [Zizania latifolia]